MPTLSGMLNERPVHVLSNAADLSSTSPMVDPIFLTSTSLRSVDMLEPFFGKAIQSLPEGFMLCVNFGSAELARDGDPLTDPTALWGDRDRVTLGRLELTGIATDRERDGDVLVFDPTRVPDGIRCPDDPILHARTHAYSESVRRRTGVGRDAMP